MKLIRTFALCWLVLLAGFFFGVYVYAAQIWPYSIIKNIATFAAGDVEEQTSLAEKIQNDLDLRPTRHIVTSAQLNETSAQRNALSHQESKEFRDYFSGYGPEFKELKGLPLKQRRKNPMIYLSKDAPRGYRVIYGVFDFQNSLHGVILLDPDGNVANVWQTSQEGVTWQHRPDSNVYPHGLEITPDGSIITAYDGGTSLIKYDYCGRELWATQGKFNHSVQLADGGKLWTWVNNWLTMVDSQTGKSLKEFHILNIMKANPLIDIFGILQDYDGNWIDEDPTFYWHANDIEALPKKLEKYYPQFRAGDLLVSLRQPDLIFVVDPETLKVKWWRQGLARRPHDPDWNDRGTITIFNNNMHRGFSNIMEVDPKTMDYQIALDGKDYHFYSSIRGKHQLEPDGSYLITSSNQGRVFEVTPAGKVTFELLNIYNERDGGNVEYLAVSEARFLPEGFFKNLPKCN